MRGLLTAITAANKQDSEPARGASCAIKLVLRHRMRMWRLMMSRVEGEEGQKRADSSGGPLAAQDLGPRSQAVLGSGNLRYAH
jgi:hypothetical protein